MDARVGAEGPGRSCPLHYRYRPATFAQPADPSWRDLETLYVVGGLYGNAQALARVQALFEAEPGRKRLIFNGDFHWFDIDPVLFERVQRGVLAHAALRGNVETELAGEDDGAGCGCAYPAWIDEGVVERSNRILQRLRAAADAQARLALSRLPMGLRADVAGVRVAVVHGDARSLAGWGFAQEHLREAPARAQARTDFIEAGVDVFASSHTCLPVFQPLRRTPADSSGSAATEAEPYWILNNGAAGMPNFRHEAAGLLTRLSVRPGDAALCRAAARIGPLHAEAIAIEVDRKDMLTAFLAQWPPGSDAHRSYWSRLSDGPDYCVDDVLRPIG